MKRLRIGRRRAQAAPSSPLELARAPALDEDGRWQVPDRFNLARDVVEALAANPKREAATFLGPDGVIEPRTFLQLAEGSWWWATILREKGVEPGDRVLVLAGMSADWMEIVLGCMKIGAVTVPCAPNLPASALEVRVSVTGASLVVADPECRAAIAHMSFAPEVFYLDEAPRRRGSDVPSAPPTADTSSRDLAFILSTAGTSGPPKTVAHTHAAVFAARVQAEHWLDTARGDVVWCPSEPDSVQTVWNTVAGPWARGARVVLHQGEFDPAERLDLIHRLGTTILCQTPAEYRALAERREFARYRPPRIRRLVSTGDHLDLELASAYEEAWGVTIHDGYGQAETGIVIANGADAGYRPGSIGLALPGHEVAVVDEQGNELLPGLEGDIAVQAKSPTMFAGYWDSPEETKAAFLGDWYLTGDVAVRDEEGFFQFLGRADDVITSRGRTFGPFEVERVLRAHGAVERSGVVGIRDLERGGHFVRAFVALRHGVEGSEQLEAELRQYAAESLPEQEVPREIVFVDELPATATGAVQRLELRERPVAERPLWDVPAPAKPEAGAVAEPSLTGGLPSPEAPPEPDMIPGFVVEPIVEPIAEARPEPEPVVPTPPEPVAEAAPQFDVIPEPEPVVEPAPAFEPVPEPVVEPVAETAPAFEPVPEPEPVVEAAPAVEPVPEPVAGPVAPEPQLEPEPEPAPEPVAEEAAAPEPSPAAPPIVPAGPLPDYIVAPGESRQPVVPLSEPEPEPEEDLGPLPDFVVDPERRLHPVASAEAESAAPETTPPGPSLEGPLKDLGLRPVEFPTPTTDEEKPAERGRRMLRRARPTHEAEEQSKRDRSTGEPGDEPEEVGWMQGLSSRLSAYSLGAGTDSPAQPAPEDDELGDEPAP